MSFKTGKSLSRFGCTVFGFALFATLATGTLTFAQSTSCPGGTSTACCLLDESVVGKLTSYKKGLVCTANDVSLSQVKKGLIFDFNGNPISTCIEGAPFSFVADFDVVTTANAINSGGRDNVGLYIATAGQASALTGQCADNVISPLHACTNVSGVTCGSDNYHELDPPPDNCGDTSSPDVSPIYGASSEGVTVEVPHMMCPSSSNCTTPDGVKGFEVNYCTSWQTPGSSNQCVASNDTYPAPPAAIPGTVSKCNCNSFCIPITPVTTSALVGKACNTTCPNGPTSCTGSTPNPPTFTFNTATGMVTANPTSCDAGIEGGPVTYTVAILPSTNSGDTIIDQICDSMYGTIVSDFSPSTCAPGTATISGTTCQAGLDVPAGTTTPTTCTFTASVGELVTNLIDQVTVYGHAKSNPSVTFNPPPTSNTVTVYSDDATSTARAVKNYNSTVGACATVRYDVEVDNTSAFDEVETLSALTEDIGTSHFDITKCTNDPSCANTGGALILGTTCGVSNGIGTLSGSPGVPFGTIQPGSAYKCQFDAQFCSTSLTGGCFSQSDTVTATLGNGEVSPPNETGYTLTSTSTQLTVKECIAGSGQ